MPGYSTVNAELNCWNCSARIDTAVDIQWGKVPAQYQLGDSIEWFKIDGATVPPFLQVGCQRHWNCGDPQVTSLLALDLYVYGSEAVEVRKCSVCKKSIDHAVVKIVENKIVSVDSYSNEGFNELLGFARGSKREQIFSWTNDGRYEPREQWYDHPIEYVTDFP